MTHTDGGGAMETAPPATRASAGAFLAVEQELDEAKSLVASRFLSVAESLQSIAARTRSLAEASRAAAERAAEGESNRAIRTLQNVVADSERVQRVAESTREKLQETLASLRGCRASLAQLAKFRLLLQVFAMLARIEGNRLRNESVDIAGLAADIRRLAEQIESHISSIETEATLLTEVVARSGEQLRAAEQKERQQANDLIGRTGAVLTQLRERGEASRTAVVNINGQYGEIRRVVDKIVMSLQAEDIARQRMEHVQEALQQVSQALESGEPEGQCTQILLLQRSQVEGTRDMLADSLRSLHDALAALDARVGKLTAETAALASQTDADGRGFASAVEEGLGMVCSVFERHCDSSRALESAVQTALPSLERMAARTTKLEEIEFSVRLIALNAIIKSEHLGTEGVSISTLASQLQEHANQGGEQTRAVLGALRSIASAVEAISGGGGAAAGSFLSATSADKVKQDLGQLTDSVGNSSRAISEKLAELLELAGVLRNEVRGSSEVVDDSNSVLTVFDSLLRRLDMQLEKMGHQPGAANGLKMEETVSRLSGMYSMASEREAHQKVFELPTDAATPPAAEDPDGKGGECDDGVELF